MSRSKGKKMPPKHRCLVAHSLEQPEFKHRIFQNKKKQLTRDACRLKGPGRMSWDLVVC
jgi:hypothetical protein